MKIVFFGVGAVCSVMATLLDELSNKSKQKDINFIFVVRNIKKAHISEPFHFITNYYSAAASATSGRSTNSMYAIGALSPARKPHFKIRV